MLIIKIKKLIPKIFIILFFSLIQINVFGSNGGFIIPENTSFHRKKFKTIHKVNRIKNEPQRSTVDRYGNNTPENISTLYHTSLYRSFHDVLKIKGFNEYYIPRLFCIVKLESSFNQYAKNFNTNGTIDTGLFQINSVWKKTCKSSLYNVESNIDCAKIVVQKQGLNAWVTYQKYGGICEKSLKI